MAPPLPMGPCKARAFGLGGAAVGSLVLGAEMQPIKKERGGRGLGLRWLPFGLGKLERYSHEGYLIKVVVRKNSPNTTHPGPCIFLHVPPILIIGLLTYLCTLECRLGLYFTAHSPWLICIFKTRPLSV